MDVRSAEDPSSVSLDTRTPFPSRGAPRPRCAECGRGVARLSLHKIQNLFRSIHRRLLVYTPSKVTRGMGYERCRVRAPLAWNLLRRDFFFREFFFCESFPSLKFSFRVRSRFCWRVGLDFDIIGGECI